jgi:hypothetical protein
VMAYASITSSAKAVCVHRWILIDSTPEHFDFYLISFITFFLKGFIKKCMLEPEVYDI